MKSDCKTFFCPLCKQKLANYGDTVTRYHCENNECDLATFDSVGKLPILVDPDSRYSLDLTSCLFADINLVNRSNDKSKILSLLKRMLQGKNSISGSNFQKLLGLLHYGASVLIVGGGTRGSGTEQVYAAAQHGMIKLYSIDVYPSAELYCIADAHCLPFPDSFFDCVIIQAVLEHVISPKIVVSEIYRVLSEKSIVYSEVPFIQSVHEGAFDFSRFTHSGHQLLFSDFCIIMTGAHHGPTQSLLFITSHYFQLLFGKLFRVLLYSTLARLSRFIDCHFFSNSMSVDIACGTYVLAQKRDELLDPQYTVRSIKSLYKGLQ